MISALYDIQGPPVYAILHCYNYMARMHEGVQIMIEFEWIACMPSPCLYMLNIDVIAPNRIATWFCIAAAQFVKEHMQQFAGQWCVSTCILAVNQIMYQAHACHKKLHPINGLAACVIEYVRLQSQVMAEVKLEWRCGQVINQNIHTKKKILSGKCP